MENTNDNAAWNAEQFEQDWIECNETIIKDLMANADIEKIKQEVRSKGHVTDEHKDQFIRKVNEIKNKHVTDKYGEVGSESYEKFIRSWERWQKERGKDRQKPANMFEENINHLLYGSTPDPDLFLRDFNIYTDIN